MQKASTLRQKGKQLEQVNNIFKCNHLHNDSSFKHFSKSPPRSPATLIHLFPQEDLNHKQTLCWTVVDRCTAQIQLSSDQTHVASVCTVVRVGWGGVRCRCCYLNTICLGQGGILRAGSTNAGGRGLGLATLLSYQRGSLPRKTHTWVFQTMTKQPKRYRVSCMLFLYQKWLNKRIQTAMQTSSYPPAPFTA